MPNLFSQLPYLITGDNYDRLKKYDPNSRKKISILGWFTIIPTFLWFLSSFLLSYKILESGLLIALLTGVIAGTMIFIFERNIVQSIKTHWFLTLLRVTLGLLISIYSSVILDLVIFKSDIDYYAQFQLINSQEQKVKDASQNLQVATDIFNKEMEGASNSKMKGFGRIAKEKKEQVIDKKTKLAESEAGLLKIKEEMSHTANPVSMQLFSGLGLNTILNRIKLLHEFVNQNTMALWAWIILLMIGTLLEIFGVLTKCFYPKSAYEEDQEAVIQMMANKRRIVLEQSMYYHKVGMHGREALDSMENRNRSILN